MRCFPPRDCSREHAVPTGAMRRSASSETSLELSRAVRLDQPDLEDYHGRLHSIPECQFGEDLAHMGLDRGFGDKEVLSDLRVRESFSHLDEHIAFAFRPRIELG